MKSWLPAGRESAAAQTFPNRRFLSDGYQRGRLIAVRIPHPLNSPTSAPPPATRTACTCTPPALAIASTRLCVPITR